MRSVPLLANPTENGAFFIVPFRSFMPWFLFAMCVLFDFSMIANSGKGAVLGPVFANMMMGMVFGSSVRDQMNCPMTLLLPHHQQGYRRHLIVLGLMLNLLMASMVFLSPTIPLGEKPGVALVGFILGLCIYFAVVRYLLIAESMMVVQIVFPFFWVMFSLSAGSIGGIGEYLLNGYVWFVLLLVLLAYQFWITMDQPGLSRKLMEMPSTDTGFGGNINDMSDLEASRQAWFYRKRQHWPVYHWIANLRQPFNNALAEHMLMVFKRCLELLLRVEFWFVFVMLAFVHPWVVVQRDMGILLLVYPVSLFLYMQTIVTPTDVSPFMPYSRMSRIYGLLLVDLFAVLVYFVFFVGGTYFFYQLFTEPGNGYFVYGFWRLAAGLSLFLPYILLVQLVMGLVRDHLVLVMIASMLIMIFIAGVIFVHFRNDASYNLEAVYIWLFCGWSVYLFSLWWRYKSGPLSVA